jgi:hypothetical protein
VVIFYTDGQKKPKTAGIMQRFRVKSRSLHVEYDDMAGLGSFPAGLFSFPEEKLIRNRPLQQTEMHLLWTITQ